jgi:hypothetical protein
VEIQTTHPAKVNAYPENPNDPPEKDPLEGERPQQQATKSTTTLVGTDVLTDSGWTHPSATKKKGGSRELVWMSMINLQLAETASSRKQAVHELGDIESIAPLSCIPPRRLARSFYPVSSHMKILHCRLQRQED